MRQAHPKGKGFLLAAATSSKDMEGEQGTLLQNGVDALREGAHDRARQRQLHVEQRIQRLVCNLHGLHAGPANMCIACLRDDASLAMVIISRGTFTAIMADIANVQDAFAGVSGALYFSEPRGDGA